MEPANRPSFPALYERELVGPLFRPWAEVLLDRTGLVPGDRLLDLACGTGVVARLAAARLAGTGRVVGIDASPQMLEVARGIAPEIEWREGRAESLPVSDGEQFDVLVCQQGLQFFADKPAAAREMHRVLAPRGRLVVATWRPIEEIPMFRELHEVAERHVGSMVDQRHAFGDAEALRSLLTDAGFQGVKIETLSRKIRFENPLVFVRLNAMAIAGMNAATKSLSDDARAQLVAAIVEDSARVLPAYAQGSGIEFEIRSNVATARRS